MYFRISITQYTDFIQIFLCLGYIFGMQNSVGRIHVRFGEPVTLQDSAEVPAALQQTSTDEQQARTLQLALEVSRRIEHATLVTPQSLVCLALLASEGETVDVNTLQARLTRLLNDVISLNLPREATLGDALSNGLAATLQGLADSVQPSWHH